VELYKLGPEIGVLPRKCFGKAKIQNLAQNSAYARL